MTAIKILLKIPGLIIRLVYAVGALVVIGVVGYFFCHFYLQGLWGTDTGYALNLVAWVVKYFPKIPFWYHLQGAGVSMKWSYPLLPSILVVVIDKVSHLGILGSFQVLGFSSFLLTAVGMYIFVSWRLKNQTAALISAIFYLITPLSYAYFVDWGFYAEAISCLFFFPPLIFYDLFLTGFLSGKLNWWHRLGLLLAVVLSVILFNAHPNTFFTLFFVIGWQTIIRAIFTLKIKLIKSASVWKLLTKAFFPSLLVFLLTVLAGAFIIFNFSYYEAAKKDIAGPDENLVKIEAGDLDYFTLYNSLPRKSFLGLEQLVPGSFLFASRNITIIPLVWILALIGMVLTLFFDRKVFAYVFPALFGFGIIVYPEVFFGPIRFLVKLHFPGLGYILKQRVYLTLIRSLFPIAAAFALVGAGKLLFAIPFFWRRWVKNRIFTFSFALIRNLFVAVFSLAAFLGLLYWSGDKPTNLWSWYQARYGFFPVDIRDPFGRFTVLEAGDTNESRLANLRAGCSIQQNNGQSAPICLELSEGPYFDLDQDNKVLETVTRECLTYPTSTLESQLCPLIATSKRDLYLTSFNNLKNLSVWPKPDLFKPEAFPGQIFPYPTFVDFANRVAAEKNLRVDVSPTAGGLVMGLNAISDMSIVSLYLYQASLIGPYWGYEQQVLFQQNDGREETATEMAKWLGIKYLLMNSSIDATQKYFQKGGWEAELKDEDGRAGILKLKNAPSLATWTKDKPTVLVIGSKQRRVFEPVFRVSNKGALPYDNYWLVEGNERIDDYSLSELKQFDILYLFGYGYKYRTRAWNLIDAYLRAGGKVFISTGWQYVDRDFEQTNPPAWLPAASLTWTEKFNKRSAYDFNLSAINSKVDTAEFGPLEWNGAGYGVSAASGLRAWAKPVLSVDGVPLLAVGEYGKGRIVWSGLNLIGHMNVNNYNQSELLFFRSLFDWLRGNNQPVDLSNAVEIIRDNPDKVSLNFSQNTDSQTVLYWRESFFPSWQAKLVSGNHERKIKIYFAGPRLMLMPLPVVKTGDKLILEFKPGLRHLWLKLVSFTTLMGLLIYLMFGLKMFQPVLTWLNLRLGNIKAKARSVKEDGGKEEEY